MPARAAVALALGAVLLAPLAFSLHLLSFLHAKELVYANALVLLAVLAQFTRTDAVVPRWAVALLLWLTLMAGVSCALGPHFRAPLEQWTHAVLVLAVALAVLTALPEEQRCRYLPRAVWGSAVLVAMLGLLQYFGLANALLPVFPHYDQRMYSVFGNQDLLGGYLACTLPLVLAAAIHGPRQERFLAYAALPVVLGALLLSASRSAWLAAGLVTLGYLLHQSRKTNGSSARDACRLLALLALAVVCAAPWWAPRALASFGDADTGGNLRLWFYVGTWHLWRANAWLGVGLGHYGLHSPPHLGAVLHAPGGERFARNELFTDHAHCDPLETLAETGVLGVFLLVGLACWAMRGVRLRPWAAPWVAASATFGIFSLLNPVLHSAPHVLVPLLGLGVALDTSAQPARLRLRMAWVHLAAPVLMALWLYTTLLPSALGARVEDVAQPPCVALEAHERLLRWFHGPPHAYENALFLAEACLRAEEDPDLAAWRGRVDALFEAGQQQGDTGRLHLAHARCLRALGDEVAARAAYGEVLLRWPDNAEATAFRDHAS